MFKLKKPGIAFVWLVSLAALAFFITLFSSVRPVLDDYTISLLLREGSLTGTLKWYYMNSSFRFTALLISFFTIGDQTPVFYVLKVFIYYFSLFAFFVFTLYKLIKEVFNLEAQTKNEKILLAAFSFVQVSGIYFLCSERIEIYGWITSSMVHVVPVVFALFACWLIIKRTKSRTDYPLLFLSALLIAGAAEQITAITCCAAATYIFTQRKNVAGKERRTKAIFFTGALIGIFFITITNPGTAIRMYETGFLARANAELDTAFFHFLFKPHKLAGAVIAITSWMLFPVLFSTRASEKISIKPFLFVAIMALIITMLASKASYNFFYATRLFLGADVALYILICALSLKCVGKIKHQKVITLAGTIACVAFIIFHDIRHIAPMLRYAQEFDEMVSTLKKQPANKTLNYQLHDADLLCPLSLGEKPTASGNEEYRAFYGIRANISFDESPKD